MLIKASVEDIKKYGDFVYRLALEPESSSYPTYADGIKTKADFLRDAQRAATREHDALLLFCLDGRVEGWISYYWIPEEKYLQLTGLHIHRGMTLALTELLELLEEKFVGFTAYFGFPSENQAATHELAERGFQCVESDWNHSFFLAEYSPVKCSEHVESITRDNYDLFRTVYHDNDAYWNAERIFEALDDWTIFIYRREGMPIGGIFFTGDDESCEIFGCEFFDGVFRKDVFRELLNAALGACKRSGAKYLTYFCGDEEKPVLRDLGFCCIGQYVLYTKELAPKTD